MYLILSINFSNNWQFDSLLVHPGTILAILETNT